MTTEQIQAAANDAVQRSKGSDAGTANSVAGMQKDAAEKALKAAIVEIKAKRLDQPDAVNVYNPIDEQYSTKLNIGINSIISPTGCHYSYDHYKQLVDNGYSSEDAFKTLSNMPPYNGMTDEIKKTLERNKVDLSDEALLDWNKAQGNPTPVGITEVKKNTTNDHNPTQAQIDAAKQQRKEEPSDVITVGKDKIQSDNAPTTYNEKDYTTWLCEAFNPACRNSSSTPQLPVSVAVSIALARTGCTNTNIGKFNFWKLPYTSELTSLSADEGMCAFQSAENGTAACVTFVHGKNTKDALSNLKDKMEDSTEEDKKKTILEILKKIDVNNAEDKAKEAIEYINKYSLFDWDTNKTVAEGGHADQNLNNNSKTNADGNGMQDKIAKTVGRVLGLVGKKGDGFSVRPVGSDYSEITKLPKGKTYCEPIYPDYITVGDTVPEWVFSDTYAAIAEELQKKALQKVGITLPDDEADGSNSAELNKYNADLQSFKDQQFAKWCQDNNITYEDDAGKADAITKYNAAANTDGTNFKDGIYIPDASSQSTYDALLTKRKSILSNGSLTSQQYQAYNDYTKNVKSEIETREGRWNQNTGTYTPEKNATSGGSAVESGTTSNPSQNQNSAPLSPQTVKESPKGSDTTAPDARIEKAVQWALNIAGDQSHGYTQGAENATDNNPYTGSREGPDYDCSSFVYHALNNSGFKIIAAWKKNPEYQNRYKGKQESGDADTIWTDLQSIGGFTKYSWDEVKDSLWRGDILCTPSTHVAMYAGGGKTVEAKGASEGSYETGDQGNEIGQFEAQGRGWTEVYRYTGK